MRQQVVALVEQLEARARGLPLVTGAGRERGDHVSERLEHPHHQPDGRVGQGLQLRVGLLGVGEEALEDLQQDLVADVEQVGDPGRQRVGDQRDLDVPLGRADVGRDHRPDRVESGVGLAHLLVLIEDFHELPEMGVPPFSARTLALLEDRVDRLLRRGQVGDRDQFRPLEMLRGGLGPRRPDEQPRLPVLLAQVREARLDGPVQVPDRGEVLRPGNDVALAHQRLGPAHGDQTVGIVQVHALGPFQEHEVAQRLLAERQQCQLYPGRVVIGGLRQVRPDQVRRAADRRQQVLHQGQVQHLLGGHMKYLRAPAVHRGQLGLGQPLVGGLLEREGGEQVLAHDPVLELGRLAEHVDQRLAVLDHEWSLGRRRTPACGDQLRETSATAGRLAASRLFAVGHDWIPLFVVRPARDAVRCPRAPPGGPLQVASIPDALGGSRHGCNEYYT